MKKLVNSLIFGSCAFSFSLTFDNFKCKDDSLLKVGDIEVSREFLNQRCLYFNSVHRGIYPTISYQISEKGFDLESRPFIKIKFSELSKVPFSMNILLTDKYRNVIKKCIRNISSKTPNGFVVFNILAPGSIGSSDFIPSKIFSMEFIFDDKADKKFFFTLKSISVHKNHPLLKVNQAY